jgi:hypothetical protein
VKLNFLFALMAACVALMVTESFAVRDTCYSAPDTCYVCRRLEATPSLPTGAIIELDLGICDTVRIGPPICPLDSSVTIGDSIAIPIYLYSSNAIGGLTLGFRHDGRGLKFGGYDDGWDPTGGILTTVQQSWILWAVDTLPDGQPRTDSGSALMGWWDPTSEEPLARNTTNAAKLLGLVWLVLTDTIHQTIRFDSLFYPPAGPFILVCRDSTGPTSYIDEQLTPKLVTWEGTFPPCGTNPGDTPCGDVNGSGSINIVDVVYMVNYIFVYGAPPQDPRGGDIDCDLRITIADVVYLINYVFRAGPKPCLACE